MKNFLMHGQTIKYGGGCPVSPFNTKLFLEYFSFSDKKNYQKPIMAKNFL